MPADASPADLARDFVLKEGTAVVTALGTRLSATLAILLTLAGAAALLIFFDPPSGSANHALKVPVFDVEIPRPEGARVLLLLTSVFYLVFKLLNAYRKNVEVKMDKLLQQYFGLDSLPWFAAYPTIPRFLARATRLGPVGRALGGLLVLLELAIPGFIFAGFWLLADNDVGFFVTAGISGLLVLLGLSTFFGRLTPTEDSAEVLNLAALDAARKGDG